MFCAVCRPRFLHGVAVYKWFNNWYPADWFINSLINNWPIFAVAIDMPPIVKTEPANDNTAANIPLPNPAVTAERTIAPTIKTPITTHLHIGTSFPSLYWRPVMFFRSGIEPNTLNTEPSSAPFL